MILPRPLVVFEKQRKQLGWQILVIRLDLHIGWASTSSWADAVVEVEWEWLRLLALPLGERSGFGRGNGKAPCFGAGLDSWVDIVVRVGVDATEDAAVGVDEEANGDVEGARVCEINAAVCARCGKRCPFSLRCRRLWEIPSLLLTLQNKVSYFVLAC